MNHSFFRRGPVAVASLSCLLAVAVAAPEAGAGGMNLHTRGVRPSARGGAFVGGADDLGALWFNPAGLVHTVGPHRNFLFDVAYVNQAVDYKRVDSSGDPEEQVSNEAPGLPVPSIGYGQSLNSRTVIAFGMYAPYAGLGKFKDDGPQRYSTVDLSESLIVVFTAGVAFKLSKNIRVGATVENMVSNLVSKVVMSGCPRNVFCFPEDPQWDAMVKATQLDLLSPSVSLGAQFDLGKLVTFGASARGPFWIDGRGKVEARLPTSPQYDGAHVEGDRGDLSFVIPPVLRAGLEFHPGRWRFEAAVDAELWSMHKEIRIEPKDVRIENLGGIGTYELGPVVIPRHFKNSYAGSIGVETQPLAAVPLRLLGGYTYETAAAPDEYLSVLTVDGNKQVFAGGVGFKFGTWTIDAMGTFATMDQRTVKSGPVDENGVAAPGVGMVPQLNPVRTEEDPRDVARVNFGSYNSSWFAAGVGVTKSF